jgi:RNase P subunit RPR2
MQRYFCDKCAADQTVSHSVGINPMAVVSSCLHCGALINTASSNESLEQRVSRLEFEISVIKSSLVSKP